MRQAVTVVSLALAVSACAPLLTHETRAGKSSLGCMQASLAGQDFATRPDTQAHCIAAGLIALRCSVSEAWLASYGKELRDLLGRGDAATGDLKSDRQGIHCARSATDSTALIACCEAAVGS